MTKPGSSGDLYEMLGVPRDASAQDIKKAFRVLARECHPDVAGGDPAKLERFKQIRAAYEVLADPAQRARYDRKDEPRSGPFVGSFWQRAGVGVPAGKPGRPEAGRGDPKKDLDLEDIFNDFSNVGDFGFGGPSRGSPRAPPPPRPPPRAERPEPGKDISLQVDVPAGVVESGGTLTVRYQRLRRADDGRTLYRYDELHDLRIPPGTAHGETLRVANLGDAGMHGGPYGDLVCDVRLVGVVPKDPGRMKMPRAADADGDVVKVDITIAEAILGGRVMVPTPMGAVRVSVPPGTSSGTRFRLRGKGAGGTDLYAELRIVVPKEIDEESKRLIERFGELNPGGD